MQWSKLNIFQRLVRQWDAMHPYNAAQVMQLDGAADLPRLTHAWRETLSELGLGRVQMDAARSRYRIEVLNGDLRDMLVPLFTGECSIESLITAELNRAFDRDNDFPLRPFVLDAGEAHFLGVTYQHWLADSASIRVVLREWLYRICDPALARRSPLRNAASGYWHTFGPGRGGWSLDQGLLASLRWSSRLKRVKRVERPQFADYRTQFTSRELPDGIIEPLLLVARRRRVTLNDIFLAAVAEACNRHVPLHRTARRQDLALGTIVDLRARQNDDMSDVFGLFLGFTSVVCRPRHLLDWESLLERIAAQNRIHKRSGIPESSMIRMLAGLAAHRMLSPDRIKHFYRKRLPLAGGVSNVNLNGSWVREFYPHPLKDYIRVSPCGPMMPLVFTPTTLGNHLNFGLSYRVSIIPPEAADAMCEMFANRLTSLVASDT